MDDLELPLCSCSQAHTGRRWPNLKAQQGVWVKNLYALFQAASRFQCVAFQERVLENTKVKIKYLIPLCERHENESHPD